MLGMFHLGFEGAFLEFFHFAELGCGQFRAGVGVGV